MTQNSRFAGGLWFTTKELAEAFFVTPRTVRRWVHAKLLEPRFRLRGGTCYELVFLNDEVARFMDRVKVHFFKAVRSQLQLRMPAVFPVALVPMPAWKRLSRTICVFPLTAEFLFASIRLPVRGALISSWIERTVHPFPSALQHMRIDHGGADIFVPQEFLHGANVIPIFPQVSGKTVSQCVTAPPFRHPGPTYSAFHRLL